MKRKRSKARKSPMKRGAKRPFKKRRMNIKQMVKQVLNKNLETKKANYSTTDGNEIFHNNFITITPNILATTQGTADPQGPTNQNCRIGDEINLRGVSLKMMVELNERYSDVTFRLMVVKAAKGDAPTRATLFNGLSGNKMLDSVNSERYTVLHQKFFKIKAPNPGVSTTTGGTTAESSVLPPPAVPNYGIFYGDDVGGPKVSRATKIVKVWIPGRKLVRNGVVKYEDGSSQVKFFDYHVLLYAYSNYSTSQDVVYVGRLNDYVQQLYFKDA